MWHSCVSYQRRASCSPCGHADVLYSPHLCQILPHHFNVSIQSVGGFYPLKVSQTAVSSCEKAHSGKVTGNMAEKRKRHAKRPEHIPASFRRRFGAKSFQVRLHF